MGNSKAKSSSSSANVSSQYGLVSLSLLEKLIDMGYEKTVAEKALIMTNNTGASEAVEWIKDHFKDETLSNAIPPDIQLSIEDPHVAQAAEACRQFVRHCKEGEWVDALRFFVPESNYNQASLSSMWQCSTIGSGIEVTDVDPVRAFRPQYGPPDVVRSIVIHLDIVCLRDLTFKYWFPLSKKIITIMFVMTHSDPPRIAKLSKSHTREIPIKNDYTLRLRDPVRMHSISTYNIEADEDLILFFARPPLLPQQPQIEMKMSLLRFPGNKEKHATVETDLPSATIHSDGHDLVAYRVCTGKHERARLHVDFVFTNRKRYLTLSTAATANDRKCDIVAPQPLSEAECAAFLRTDPVSYNFQEPRFQAWLDEGGLRWSGPGGDESDIDFGHRVLRFINNTISYCAAPEVRGCGLVGVAGTVEPKRRETDCGGKALIFAAAMRANGIPARIIQGQFAETEEQKRRLHVNRDHGNVSKDEVDLGYHCMAEFYARGNVQAWVPVESSDGEGTS